MIYGPDCVAKVCSHGRGAGPVSGMRRLAKTTLIISIYRQPLGSPPISGLFKGAGIIVKSMQGNNDRFWGAVFCRPLAERQANLICCDKHLGIKAWQGDPVAAWMILRGACSQVCQDDQTGEEPHLYSLFRFCAIGDQSENPGCETVTCPSRFLQTVNMPFCGAPSTSRLAKTRSPTRSISEARSKCPQAKTC